MMRLAAALIGLFGLIVATPAQAVDPARIGQIAGDAEFAGVILISRGNAIIYARAFGTVEPDGAVAHRLDARWRWGSITKQIVATLAMQEVAAGNLALDAPISRYWPEFAGPNRDSVTIGQLMRHMSGLPDPEETPMQPDGVPRFYAGMETADFCGGASRAPPGAGYHYNNCDYIILGTILEQVTQRSLDSLVIDKLPGTIRLFPAGRESLTGFHRGIPEPRFDLSVYAGAGGLNGTIFDLWAFDRLLMTGALLDEETQAQMWTGDPAIGYTALGQWVFPVPLSGCDTPPRLVERPGAIGGVQARNYILPELDMTVITFTNRSEADFQFGDLWQREGFAHDLLSAAACPVEGE